MCRFSRCMTNCLKIKQRQKDIHWVDVDKICLAYCVDMSNEIGFFQATALRNCMERFLVAYKPCEFCHRRTTEEGREIYFKIVVKMHESKDISSLSCQECSGVIATVGEPKEQHIFAAYAQAFAKARISGHEMAMITNEKLKSLCIQNEAHRQSILNRVQQITIRGYPLCHIRSWRSE